MPSLTLALLLVALCATVHAQHRPPVQSLVFTTSFIEDVVAGGRNMTFGGTLYADWAHNHLRVDITGFGTVMTEYQDLNTVCFGQTEVAKGSLRLALSLRGHSGPGGPVEDSLGRWRDVLVDSETAGDSRTAVWRGCPMSLTLLITNPPKLPT